MPKDEFSQEDPFELVGHGVPAGAEAIDDMATCFIEEFVLMGYSDPYILGLFRSPAFAGTHMVYQAKGEEYVRTMIDRVRLAIGPFAYQTVKEEVHASGA